MIGHRCEVEGTVDADAADTTTLLVVRPDRRDAVFVNDVRVSAAIVPDVDGLEMAFTLEAMGHQYEFAIAGGQASVRMRSADYGDEFMDQGWTGADPVAMARMFKDKIHHVHWKDLEAEWEPKRGTLYGCGFSTIALGDGVIDVKGVCDVLKDCDIASSTLEIVGDEDILKRSVSYLHECGI